MPLSLSWQQYFLNILNKIEATQLQSHCKCPFKSELGTDVLIWWQKRWREFLEPWTRVWLGSYILLTLWLQHCLHYSKPTEKIQFPGEIFPCASLLRKLGPNCKFFKLMSILWCSIKTVLGFETLLSMSPIMIGLSDLISWWPFQELIMR